MGVKVPILDIVNIKGDVIAMRSYKIYGQKRYKKLFDGAFLKKDLKCESELAAYYVFRITISYIKCLLKLQYLLTYLR